MTMSSSANEKAEFHHTAMLLKNSIASAEKPSIYPPSSTSLNTLKACDSIPPELYNFICLVTGLTEDTDHEQVKPDQDSSTKAVSICQDIMSLATGNPSVKSMALGLTVRHATGSKYLINLLNGLGHTPTYDAVLRAETMIAYQQRKNTTTGHLPADFQIATFTCFVFDNIDFQEETLSGSGTSHYVNGIMFQLAADGSVVSVSARSSELPVPKDKKTFTPQKEDIEPYILYRKKGPVMESNPAEHTQSDGFRFSKLQDFHYALVKQLDESDEFLPGWTAYNIKHNQPLPKSVLHYLPIIEAPATELATISHVMKSVIDNLDRLKCDAAVLVFDQAIYSKAQQIRWTDTVLCDRLVLRLGEFHTLCSFLTTVSSRFRNSGLEDILIESGIVAAGSMNSVLRCTSYNKCIRAYKLMYEALRRLQIADFLDNASLDDREAFKDGSAADVNSIAVAEASKRLDDYVAKRCGESELYSYWQSFIDMMGIALCFIRATRTGSFSLHLDSLREMLPWFFAYDKVNYARYVCTEFVVFSSCLHVLFKSFVVKIPIQPNSSGILTTRLSQAYRFLHDKSGPFS